VNALARSFLAGEQTVEAVAERGAVLLGRPWRWINPLARRYVETFAWRVRPRHRDVVAFLLADAGFKRAWTRHFNNLSVEGWLTGPQRMQPVAAAAGWSLPTIESVVALADWLHLTVADLQWFADLKGLGGKRSDPRLTHYHYRLLAKKSGKLRLIEAPKPRLKQIQRQMLSEILDKIPVHAAAHGFVKGRSIKTFATPHIGQSVVVRMDLQDFFPSFAARRIQAFFRTVGYPESVADLLGGLATNAARFNAGQDAEIDPSQLKAARALYARPHLPQGAPTSPALANLCAYRLDCRLSALAQKAGATYTRYADDLAFSGDGDFKKRAERFTTYAAAIALEEGFQVNHHKTRIMSQGVRQHLAGLVTNERLNVGRAEVDRLKAILTNCVRQGAAQQNREGHADFRAHLAGRVGFVVTINAAKGARLRRVFEQIEW